MNLYFYDDLDAESKTALEAVFSRAATDKEFRLALIASPHQAIAEETGIIVPEQFKLRFIENEGADLTIVLPDIYTGELALADLELVAGGCVYVDGDVRICVGADISITIKDASIECVVDIL